MRLKIELDLIKIKNFLKYCSDYVEILFMNEGVYMVSSSSDSTVLLKLTVLQIEDDLRTIRFPSYILKSLKTESILDIYTGESTITFTFLSDKGKPAYLIEINNQVSVISITLIKNILLNINSYTKYDLGKYRDLLYALSKLNINVISMNNKIFGEFIRSYIFTKSDLPEFMINSRIIYKAMDISPFAYFIDRYIVLKDNDITIFLNKLRIPMYCDLDYIEKFKYSMRFSLNVANFTNLNEKLDLSRECIYTLDIDKNTLTAEENFKKLTVLLNITIEEDLTVSENDIDKLIENINNPSMVLPIAEKPKIVIPSWIVNNNLLLGKSVWFITSNFVIIKLKKFRILFARGGVSYEKSSS